MSAIFPFLIFPSNTMMTHAGPSEHHLLLGFFPCFWVVSC